MNALHSNGEANLKCNKIVAIMGLLSELVIIGVAINQCINYHGWRSDNFYTWIFSFTVLLLLSSIYSVAYLFLMDDHKKKKHHLNVSKFITPIVVLILLLSMSVEFVGMMVPFADNITDNAPKFLVLLLNILSFSHKITFWSFFYRDQKKYLNSILSYQYQG